MEPIVQLALDFVDLPRAMKVAEAAFDAGVTRLEAGTPLIKACGLEAVRALRARFPGARVVADMKVMDTGRAEAEIAFKAGADIVTVMGNAADGTIREAVEAAANYGGRVMVDLMEEAATLARAKAAVALGCHELGVHIPIDEQMAGRISFSFLAEVAREVSVPVAVAGGVNSENAVAALGAGASLLIVGGAVTKAENVAAAVGAILTAVRTRKAVRTDLYKRVTLEDVRSVFDRVSTANVSDALHRRGWIEGVRPVFEGARAVGPALTVRTCPGDWAKPVEAIDRAAAGDVLVIDAGGVPPAVWGELATNSAVTRKLAGVVIHGAIRDVADIRAVRFPSFATLVAPSAAEPKGLGEIGAPIRIGGQQVETGDWIVADDDGVVAVPRQGVVEAANRAMDVLEKENRLRREIKDGGTLSEIAELLKWEKPR